MFKSVNLVAIENLILSILMYARTDTFKDSFEYGDTRQILITSSASCATDHFLYERVCDIQFNMHMASTGNLEGHDVVPRETLNLAIENLTKAGKIDVYEFECPYYAISDKECLRMMRS